MSDVIKEYSNDDITVVWQAAKCSHSGVCAKKLAEVFNPRERPWINMQGSDTETIAKTVRLCPSGALSIKGDDQASQTSTEQISIKIIENGPMLVDGKVILEMADGTKKERTNPALCRCGKSANKPFCDGAHAKTGFTG